VLAAAPDQRPTYLGLDLRALTSPYREPTVDGASATCGGVSVSADGTVSGESTIDGLRAAAALAWSGTLPEDRYDVVLRQLGVE
jgi:hypothetical protein